MLLLLLPLLHLHPLLLHLPVPRGRVSPIGWDKSHPLEPVEAVNPEMTRSATGIYKQNVVSAHQTIKNFGDTQYITAK